MSTELETNGLLGMDPPQDSPMELAGNGLLAGFREDGLQGNGLLAMMEDDQMLLDIESGVGTLGEKEENAVRTNGTDGATRAVSTEPSTSALPSFPASDVDYDLATSNFAGPSKQRTSTLHVARDDTALRNAQALAMPRMFASTSDGKFVSFGRKVRRKWDGVAVSLSLSLISTTLYEYTFSPAIPSLSSRQARPMPKGDKDGRLQLLDTPYHLLLKQIDRDEAERADQTLQANLARQEHVERLERKGKGKDLGQKAMWVDKYRPTKFTDLLGEEVSRRSPSRCSSS